MKLVAVASPNHNARPLGMPVDTIVLHADAAQNAQASVSWIKSPESGVSYHVLVDRDGTVYRFVESTRRAWACGKSTYLGREDVNDFSLSLAFANKNDGRERYTDLQYEVGAAIVATVWMPQFPALALERITTHAIISPGRKTDPVGFDMPRFIGLVRAELVAQSADATAWTGEEGG
jgi:N-acetylmuramoyl-L-alanine amidase